tara:strand:- start:1040 stop:1345 length:306 start_codon:yes stop_codon:yes gene_type:complete
MKKTNSKGSLSSLSSLSSFSSVDTICLINEKEKKRKSSNDLLNDYNWFVDLEKKSKNNDKEINIKFTRKRDEKYETKDDINYKPSKFILELTKKLSKKKCN